MPTIVNITHIEDTISNLRTDKRASAWTYATDLDSVVYFKEESLTERHVYTLDSNNEPGYAINNFTASGATISANTTDHEMSIVGTNGLSASTVSVTKGNITTTDDVIKIGSWLIGMDKSAFTIYDDYYNWGSFKIQWASPGVSAFNADNSYTYAMFDAWDEGSVFIGLSAGCGGTGERAIPDGGYASTGNIAIGYQAGADFEYYSRYNIAIGSGAMTYGDTSDDTGTFLMGNVCIGTNAGNRMWSPDYEVYDSIAIGNNALRYSSNSYNVVVGHDCATHSNLGYVYGSTIIGSNTGNSLQSGDTYYASGCYNVLIGRESGASCVSGAYNICIGFQSGYSIVNTSNNIFIGYQSGFYETGSNKLYISNSNTTTPLIYGDFSNRHINIHGNLSCGIFTSAFSPSGIFNVYKDCDGNTSTGIRHNVGAHTAAAGSYGRSINNPTIFLSDSGSLTDDGAINIVDEGGTTGRKLNGYGWVSCGDELTLFSFIDGTVSCSVSSTNISTTESDGNLCIVGTSAVGSGNSTIITIINKLGQTENIGYSVWYGINETS